MKRREQVSGALVAGEAPEELRSMAGVRQFFDGSEPVPSYWGKDVATYRSLRAFRRWLDARKQWCAERGLDYVATFHPNWLRR